MRSNSAGAVVYEILIVGDSVLLTVFLTHMLVPRPHPLIFAGLPPFPESDVLPGSVVERFFLPGLHAPVCLGPHDPVGLAGVDLERALLDKIAARGTIFTRAKLRHTLVREADVKNADFWRADLFRCNFNGSDLRGADFRRAEIVGVDFRDADLRGAHFEKSAWPLWCGTRRTRVDRGIASMLAYQLYCLNCDDPDFLLVKLQIAPFAQTFPWQDRPGENDIGPEEHPALQP